MTETVSKADYDLSERENDNLRKILRWAVPLLAPDDREKMAALLDRSIDDGGAVEDAEDDHNDKEAPEKVLSSISQHFDRLLVSGAKLPPDGDMWWQRADYLLGLAREHEPKEPL